MSIETEYELVYTPAGLIHVDIAISERIVDRYLSFREYMTLRVKHTEVAVPLLRFACIVIFATRRIDVHTPFRQFADPKFGMFRIAERQVFAQRHGFETTEASPR